jgi:predicted dehydrogenase
LLDGGVHFIAGTRLLLGPAAKPTSVAAFTTLLQPHLPPVDTVNAIWNTQSGIAGTYSNSFGTTFSGNEYGIACENGSVVVTGTKVTVNKGEQDQRESTEKNFVNEGNGVEQEVAAWAQALVDKTPNPKQSPEEALADLEILEKMLLSGEAKAKVESLQFQL